MDLSKEEKNFFLASLKFLLHKRTKKVNPKPKKQVVVKKVVKTRYVAPKKAKPSMPRTRKDLFFVSSRNPLPPLSEKTLMGG